MMDHIARAAALDWQDEVTEAPSRRPELRAAVHPDAPRLSETEIFASLRHPFGRIRTQRREGAPSRAPSVEAGSSDDPRRSAGARITAFPGGETRRASRSVPLGQARDVTLDANRTESAFAGRVQGITDTF